MNFIMRRAILILGTLMLALLLAQTGREIPPCQGDECHDTSGGNTPGPSWCQNHDGGGYRSNCACRRDCMEQNYHPETGCVTWCRTPRCRCRHGCETR